MIEDQLAIATDPKRAKMSFAPAHWRRLQALRRTYGELPIRASRKPEGSIASSTRSKPGLMTMRRTAKAGVPGPVRFCEHRHPEPEPAPIGARCLLSRAELGEVDDPGGSLHRLAIAAGVVHDAGHRGMGKFGD